MRIRKSKKQIDLIDGRRVQFLIVTEYENDHALICMPTNHQIAIPVEQLDRLIHGMQEVSDNIKRGLGKKR